MSAFDGIKSIFSNPDFCEMAVIGGVSASVVASQVSAAELLGEYGVENKIDFAVEALIADLPGIPERGDVITFRGGAYKVDTTIYDSAGISVKIFIVEQKRRKS